MNLFSPVSTIMSTRLHTVSPEDNLLKIKEIFDSHRFHHVPVVEGGKIVGMISKTDFAHFSGGLFHFDEDKSLPEKSLRATHAKHVMTTHLGKIAPGDRINVAVEIFKENLFHALPVVEDNGQLVGLVTTFDVIRHLADDRPAHPEAVYQMALHEN